MSESSKSNGENERLWACLKKHDHTRWQVS